VLARPYDPQAFGLLSVYAAVLPVLVAIVSLRFDFAIPIAAEPVEAAYLLTLSVVISLVTSIGLALAPYCGSGLGVATGARAVEAGAKIETRRTEVSMLRAGDSAGPAATTRSMEEEATMIRRKTAALRPRIQDAETGHASWLDLRIQMTTCLRAVRMP